MNYRIEKDTMGEIQVPIFFQILQNTFLTIMRFQSFQKSNQAFA